MDRLFSVLKRVARGLPYLSFLTAVLYMAGTEFNTNYWRGMGLPLMATDHPFADMLYDGFLGYFLWSSSVFGPNFSPLLATSIVSFVLAGMYRALEWGGERLTAKLAAKRADPSRPPPDPRVTRVLDEVAKLLGYFVTVAIALLMVPLLVGMTALTPTLPALALGSKGFEAGEKALARYEAKTRQLRDGLVDVSIVSIKRDDGKKAASAIPIECAGDRCAVVTEDGPISLPKDRLGEESVVRAIWTEACLSPAGLAKRRHH